MSEETQAPPPGEPTPEKPKAERTTRPYMGTWRGLTFAVEATDRDNVIAHLVRRLRKEVEISVADFDDGIYCAENKIELEIASLQPDLFTPGGES